MKNHKSAPKPMVRWWDWLAAILLVLAVFTAALRLEYTNWAPELSITSILSLLGILIGLALGYSKFSVLLSFGLAWTYGLFIIPWQIGLQLPSSKDISLPGRLLIIAERINNVFVQVVAEETITDSIIFIIVMAILYWVISIYAGYSLVRRGSPWLSVLPTGVVLFVIHFYHNCPYAEELTICNNPGLLIGASYVGVFLLFTLLLIGRVTYLQRMMDWEKRKVLVGPEVGFDLMRVIIATTFIIVMLAWFVPTAQAKALPVASRIWNAAGTPVRKLTDIFGPVFESIRTTIAIPTNDFGPQLTLGRGGNLSEKVVLRVRINGPVLVDLPYYWRNRVYDQYENGQWQTTITDTEHIENVSIPLDSSIEGSEFRVSFSSSAGLSVLYTPARAIRISMPVDLERKAYPEGGMDVHAIRSVQILQSDVSYQVAAKTLPVTIMQLREANTNYPGWVTEDYLQLPDEITPRTKQLAEEIAAGLETPYDIVAAITNYLRGNLEYSETVPTPPEGQEPIDWILFDHKSAFCNYYATAEIILLRSLGIPARLVVGYAQGERQNTPNEVAPPAEAGHYMPTVPERYLVRSRDAHAWPEVYFPDIGWVEFEPTVSQEAIVRPAGGTIDLTPSDRTYLGSGSELPIMDEPEPEVDNFPYYPDVPKSRSWWATWWWAILVGALSLALIVWHGVLLVKLVMFLQSRGIQPPNWLRNWSTRIQNRPPLAVRLEAWLRKIGLRPPAFLRHWAVWSTLSPIERAYSEVNQALKRLGCLPALENTPSERLKTLETLLPETKEPSQRLLKEYQAAIYSQHTAHPAIARWAAARIRRLSIRAWLQRKLPLKRNGETPTETTESTVRP